MAARTLEAIIVVRPGAEVARLAVIGHARIGGRVAAADRRGAIGRGVVAEDQLEIGEALAEDRADRRIEVALAVEDRYFFSPISY
jgi:hypothetical protein